MAMYSSNHLSLHIARHRQRSTRAPRATRVAISCDERVVSTNPTTRAEIREARVPDAKGIRNPSLFALAGIVFQRLWVGRGFSNDGELKKW